jgi:hypothetical protein
VKIANALTMMDSAQKDLLRACQRTGDYDAMRKKLYRYERNEAAALGAEQHDQTTRQSVKNVASTEAERARAAASEILIGAAAACKDGDEVSPHEVLKRTKIDLPPNLSLAPETAALAALLEVLARRLSGPQIVLLVAASFPSSFFSEAGRLLNREVARLGPAAAGMSWKERWRNEVSGAWHVFAARLLATRGTDYGTAEPARENERFVRAFTTYLIVAFTLNPLDSGLLQSPLASMCSRGKPSMMELLGVLNTMGVSTSGRKRQLDAPARVQESTAIRDGILKVWTSPLTYPDGSVERRSVTVHVDNWDKRNTHVLLAGLSVNNPRSLFVFMRNRLRDLTVLQLITQTPEETAAAHQQLTWRAAASLAGSTDEESEAAVVGLVASERALNELIAEQDKCRQSIKLGRKKNTHEEPAGQKVVTASKDFDGGEAVDGVPRITFVAGEVLQLVAFLPPRALAVVEKGEGALRQVGYVPLQVLAGYGGGGEWSSGHLHTPAKEVLARASQHRRSLENDAADSSLQMDFEGAAAEIPGLALATSSTTLASAAGVWTASELAREEVSDKCLRPT